MIISYLRGHCAKYEPTTPGWFYCDDGSPAVDNRPCKQCGRLATLEGYDACLGYILGISWACCGHGVSEPYFIEERQNGILE